MDMRIRKPINVTLDPDMLKEMDALLARQPYKPSRASFIETAIRKEIEAERAKERKVRK